MILGLCWINEFHQTVGINLVVRLQTNGFRAPASDVSQHGDVIEDTS